MTSFPATRLGVKDHHIRYIMDTFKRCFEYGFELTVRIRWADEPGYTAFFF